MGVKSGLKLLIMDKAGLKSCSSTMIVIEDGEPPTIKLLSPNGGATYTTIYESKKTVEKNHLTEGLDIADCQGSPGNCTLGVTNSVLNIPFDEQILDLNVKINLTHTKDSDLEIILIGPKSQEVLLKLQKWWFRFKLHRHCL